MGWGVTLGSLALTGIVDGVVIPRAAVNPKESVLGIALYYLAVFGMSLLAGVVLSNVARSLIGVFAANSIAISLTFLALMTPGLTGVISETVAENLAITLTLWAFFPFPPFLGLVGALLGAVFTEA